MRKKLRSLRNVDRTVATRRLAGMLARKGYPAGMAFSVVRSELDEHGFGLDDGSADDGDVGEGFH